MTRGTRRAGAGGGAARSPGRNMPRTPRWPGGMCAAPSPVKNVRVEHRLPIGAVARRGSCRQAARRGRRRAAARCRRCVAPPAQFTIALRRAERRDMVPPIAREEERVARVEKGDARARQRIGEAREAHGIRRLGIDQRERRRIVERADIEIGRADRAGRAGSRRPARTQARL